jgi:hypothetical protein
MQPATKKGLGDLLMRFSPPKGNRYWTVPSGFEEPAPIRPKSTHLQVHCDGTARFFRLKPGAVIPSIPPAKAGGNSGCRQQYDWK